MITKVSDIFKLVLNQSSNQEQAVILAKTQVFRQRKKQPLAVLRKKVFIKIS